MKTEKRIHPGWLEEQKIPNLKFKLFSKYQYIFSSEKGKISLVGLYNQDFNDSSKIRWEIYCLEGKLFDDIIIDTKANLIKKAKELLE